MISQERLTCPLRKEIELSGQLFRFADQHDRNAVPDFIEKLAGVADQTVTFFGEINLPLALGTYQQIKQFAADGHLNILHVLIKENRVADDTKV